MVEMRRASGKDTGLIQALLKESSLPYQDLTAAHMDDFLSLYDNGRLSGCVGLEVYDGTALLRSLAVRGELRGQGLGSHLVAAAEELAARRGARSLYLLTTTAEAFFARRGYQNIERSAAPKDIQMTTEFQSICPVSAVCMSKMLQIIRS